MKMRSRETAWRVPNWGGLPIIDRRRPTYQMLLAAAIFDESAEAIIITDKHNNILSVNHAFTDITGYSYEEAIDRNPMMLSSGWGPDAIGLAMRASIRETGRWRGEVWGRRKDGEAFCGLLSMVVTLDDQGGVAQHCAIFADITLQKRAEAKLLELEKELEDIELVNGFVRESARAHLTA